MVRNRPETAILSHENGRKRPKTAETCRKWVIFRPVSRPTMPPPGRPAGRPSIPGERRRQALGQRRVPRHLPAAAILERGGWAAPGLDQGVRAGVRPDGGVRLVGTVAEQGQRAIAQPRKPAERLG